MQGDIIALYRQQDGYNGKQKKENIVMSVHFFTTTPKFGAEYLVSSSSHFPNEDLNKTKKFRMEKKKSEGGNKIRELCGFSFPAVESPSGIQVARVITGRKQSKKIWTEKGK